MTFEVPEVPDIVENQDRELTLTAEAADVFGTATQKLETAMASANKMLSDTTNTLWLAEDEVTKEEAKAVAEITSDQLNVVATEGIGDLCRSGSCQLSEIRYNSGFDGLVDSIRTNAETLTRRNIDHALGLGQQQEHLATVLSDPEHYFRNLHEEDRAFLMEALVYLPDANRSAFDIVEEFSTDLGFGGINVDSVDVESFIGRNRVALTERKQEVDDAVAGGL